MQLRPYQIDLIDRTREALRVSPNVLMQSPTGSGKTAMLVHMMKTAASRGKRSFFCVHQNELLSQTSKALWHQQLTHGVIASGRVQSNQPVQIASVQTLVRRTDKYAPPDLIIIDEAHRAAADTYRRVIDAYPGARVIGLTATPERTDGKGLNDIFQDIIEGPTIRQLIDAGYLCDYEIFAPSVGVDLSGVGKLAGDYNKKQAAEAVDKATITGDAVDHYRKLANGKRCVVMCVTIEHAKHVAAQYNVAGIPAACIEGGMSNSERDDVLQRFGTGALKVVTNVQLLVEGVDIPSIEVVQWLRPTQSLIVWMQGNGRGFRPSDGKERLIILDHVGNTERHGLPDEDRLWSLDGKKGRQKREGEAEKGFAVQQCKSCFSVFRPGVTACPTCGAEVELRTRKIEEVDGELSKVDLAAERAKAEQRKLQGTARSLEQLVRVGQQRGMKNPAAWAAHVFASREGRKPTQGDHHRARQALVPSTLEGLI